MHLHGGPDLPCSSPVIRLRRPARGNFLPCSARRPLQGQPLIMLVLMARLRVVFGAKTKISAVIRQKQRETSFPGLFLPARSLRGRPASLRTVPDDTGGLFRKRLIWRALLVTRPAISGVEPIFLPALREKGQGGGPLVTPRGERRRLLPGCYEGPLM